MVWSSMKEFSAEVDHGVRMVHWNPYTETLDKPEEYCACCEPVCGVAPQAYRYRCLGHIHEEDDGRLFQDRDPRAGGGQERRDAYLEAWRARPIAVEDPFAMDRDDGVGPSQGSGSSGFPMATGASGLPAAADAVSAKAAREYLEKEVLRQGRPFVLELASGTGQLSLELSEEFQTSPTDDAKGVCAVPVDRRGGVYRKVVPTLGEDLLGEDFQQELTDLVEAGRVVHLHCSAPGTSLDRDRKAYRLSKARPPPRELRDDDHVLGKPAASEENREGLTERELARVENDNRVLRLYEALVQRCEARGVSWTLEGCLLYTSPSPRDS